jgi:hypothetical protein
LKWFGHTLDVGFGRGALGGGKVSEKAFGEVGFHFESVLVLEVGFFYHPTPWRRGQRRTDR